MSEEARERLAKLIDTQIAHEATIAELQNELSHTHASLVEADDEIAELRERIAGLEAALQDVVDEYPVAAGTAKLMGDEDDRKGYGSIRRARAALTPAQEGPDDA